MTHDDQEQARLEAAAEAMLLGGVRHSAIEWSAMSPGERAAFVVAGERYLRAQAALIAGAIMGVDEVPDVEDKVTDEQARQMIRSGLAEILARTEEAA